MAVARMNEKVTLSVAFVDGVDLMGKEKYVRGNYSGIKTTATDSDLYDVAVEFGQLSEKTMKNISVRDSADLTE